MTFNNRSATNVPFQIRNECSMDTLYVVQQNVSRSLSTTVRPFESSPYFWDSLNSTNTFLNIYVLPLRLSHNARGITTKRNLKTLTLISSKNRMKQHEFNVNIVIATVSNVHSSILPVQNVNWGYRDDMIWVDNGLHATFRVVLDEKKKKKKSGNGKNIVEGGEKDLSTCHCLIVNPTIVGAGSRNVDGEVTECVIQGPMVRNISLIVIAEGPTKVIIVSDMPHIYKPIYPFEPYMGGT